MCGPLLESGEVIGSCADKERSKPNNEIRSIREMTCKLSLNMDKEIWSGGWRMCSIAHAAVCCFISHRQRRDLIWHLQVSCHPLVVSHEHSKHESAYLLHDRQGRFSRESRNNPTTLQQHRFQPSGRSRLRKQVSGTLLSNLELLQSEEFDRP